MTPIYQNVKAFGKMVLSPHVIVARVLRKKLSVLSRQTKKVDLEFVQLVRMIAGRAAADQHASFGCVDND